MLRIPAVPLSPRTILRLGRPPGPAHAPEPPPGLPPAHIAHVPGRGEFFYRDSGGDGPAVLLLHGWMFPADLNWFPLYRPLQRAGHRVLAMDHRGHGRGLRSTAPFRLEDCAADAAGLLETLGVEDAVAVGYSMGGPIATILARDFPDRIAGVVLCATAQEWQDPYMKALWRAMGGLRLLLGLAPDEVWRGLLRAGGFPDSPLTSWVTAELSRGSSRDLAEAGRELSRYDARPWIGEVEPPAAVVVTTRDRSVPPRKQRELAQALGAPRFEVAGDHFAIGERQQEFRRALLAALEAVRAAERRAA